MFAKIKTEFSNAPLSTSETFLKIMAALGTAVVSLFYFFSGSTGEVDSGDNKAEIPIVVPEIAPEIKPELITKVIDEPKNYQETTAKISEQKNTDLSETPKNYIEIADFVDINSNFFELGIGDDAYNLIDGNINTTVKFPSQKRTLQAKFTLVFAEPVIIKYIGIGQPNSDYQLHLSKIKIRAQYANNHWGDWVEYKIESSRGEARLNFSDSQQVLTLDFNPISSVNKFRATELGDVSIYRY
ncbi:hypothetical protein [Sessilibacter corallicola]|uniref:hypothetical protein n=1 Tax=Sessilibacter corallicola TaxID=2904075 RepID=UPI001E520AA9|nr:hypothetical protein [Sessilibacter corallicola]MCE2029066.1 hypothetical protein [Sessilibacter corallicola]